MFGFRKWRRKRIRNRPFPKEWLDILEENVPYYALLSPEEQKELQGHIQVLLHEKYFEGCGGLELTDEIRVTVAAQAAILLLNRETDYYPDLVTILIYPHMYVVENHDMFEDGTTHEDPQVRLGESWMEGIVVLSWDDVKHGSGDIHDGQNVVLHEFAHQLDGESGWTEGAPHLKTRAQYTAWARVMRREYNRLIADLRNRRPNLFGSYAATNPAEFFAVLTECFFEKPKKLKKKHPELYEILQEFYNQDPANRV
ncbi:MAG: zinc-dependent peptidase [Candidatus Omnitrophica bacterium]|nr:zinc-dependent peptidase [Candidatus Omnitrophota bacterium]MCA9448183.1 zinc-dependent peptidase [Candidatus Omnitrophota bacterium]MCB9783876.1 zinc-dependent peptidase [Candidatus Omnitrophota bacterium]